MKIASGSAGYHWEHRAPRATVRMPIWQFGYAECFNTTRVARSHGQIAMWLRAVSDATECPKARVSAECPHYGRCLRQLGQHWPIYLGLRTVSDVADRPKP